MAEKWTAFPWTSTVLNLLIMKPVYPQKIFMKKAKKRLRKLTMQKLLNWWKNILEQLMFTFSTIKLETKKKPTEMFKIWTQVFRVMPVVFIGNTIDVTGLAWTRQKPDPDYFLQTETQTRLFIMNPNKTRTRLTVVSNDDQGSWNEHEWTHIKS